MNDPIRILAVEDSLADFRLVERHLQREGLIAQCRRVETLAELERALDEGGWEIVLSDYNVPALDFEGVLRLLQERLPGLPLVLVSGSVGEERAVELLKLGVWDFVLKGNLARLAPVIRRSLRDAADRRARCQAERELSQSEARFRTLVERLPAITYVAALDAASTTLYISPQIEQVLGFTPAEYLADRESWVRQLHPEDRERVLAEVLRSQGDGTPFVAEYRMLARDGRVVWFRDEADLVRDGAEKPLFLQGLMLDITDRRRADLERETTVEFLHLVNDSGSTRELVQAAATFFQRVSGCTTVGVRLREGDDYPYYEARGFPDDFVMLENSLCERDRSGQVRRDTDGYPILECMCGNVICGRFDPAKPFFSPHGSFWTNCTTELLATTSEADRQARTRNRCNGEGYESVALLPLSMGSERLGLLQLNDRRKNMFTPETIALWERLAGHLAVAIAKLDAEEALRQSQERYRLLADYADDFVLLIEADGSETYISPSYYRRTGWQPGEVRTDDWQRQVHPDDLGRVARLYRANLAGEATRDEYRLVCRDGSWLWVESRCKPVRDTEGRVTRMVIWSREITERKRAEEALTASERRYRTLFEQAAEGILVPNVADRSLLYANPAMCRMLGYGMDELLRLKVEDIHPPDHLDMILPDFERHASGKAELTSGIPCRRKDGSTVLVDINTAPIEFDGERCLVGFFTDVTERARLAAEKEKLEAQIRQTQKLEAIGSLAGGVAHDFNNLLTGIKGYTELILDEPALDPEIRADLAEVLGLSNRAADLTRQLLAFSRKQDLRPETLNLNELVTDHLKMLGRLLGEDIDIRFLPEAGLGHVQADPGQVSQILMNLVVNARDAMPQGGRLTIETANVTLAAGGLGGDGEASAGPHVQLAVSDTGCGMDRTVQSRLFEPFFTTKEPGKGTGLGLATVHGIVKQHGGDIQVYSEPGEGTTFRIYLPRVAEECAVQPTASPPIVGGNETILLVEDEDAVRRVLARWLEKWGYTVIVAANPAEAEEIAAGYSSPIDLLLTDVVMPGRNGLELYESLAPSRPEMRVLYMSGYTGEAVRHRGVLQGSPGFVEKPVELDVLAGRVRQTLDAPPDKGEKQ